MANAYHYMNSFDDALSAEFKGILSQGFDPRQLNNLRLWLDANDPKTILSDINNKVSQWSDKSLNDNHFIPPASNLEPVTALDTKNGKNVLTFNNSVLSSNITLGSTHSIFVVGRTNSAQSNDFYMPFISHRKFILNVQDQHFCLTTKGLGRYDSGNKAISSIGDTNYHYLSALSGDSGAEFFKDGASVGVNNTTITYNYPTISIGRERPDAWSGGVSLVGQIAEIIIYNRALNQQERQQVEAYLAEKWGLSA